MLSMPKVGDRLFDKAVGNAARRSEKPKITEVEVVRVGRKYFACMELEDIEKPYSKYHEVEYYIDRGAYRQKTNCSQGHELHPSRQAILDAVESQRLHDDLRSEFSGYGCPRFSLQALREISEIVKRNKEEN